MSKKNPPSINLRESERQAIAMQIEQFLKRGGNIDKIKTEQAATRPISKSWSSGIMIGLD
jgi:hypothetical protein